MGVACGLPAGALGPAKGSGQSWRPGARSSALQARRHWEAVPRGCSPYIRGVRLGADVHAFVGTQARGCAACRWEPVRTVGNIWNTLT